MNLTWLRLGYAAVWLVLGLILLLRRWLIPAELLDRFDSQKLDLGGILALVFAAYNLVRWLLVARRGWGRRPTRTPPLARRVDKPSEYHPELDFTKRDEK